VVPSPWLGSPSWRSSRACISPCFFFVPLRGSRTQNVVNCRELSVYVPVPRLINCRQMNDNTELDTLLADIGEPWATVRDVRFSRSPLGRFAPWSLIFAFCFPDFSFSASRSDPARPSTTLREGLGLPSALSRPVWLQHRVLRHSFCPANSPACQPNTYRSGCPDADKTTGDTPIM